MGNYLKDLEEWENDFHCDECGNHDHKHFTYDRTFADGEVWHCDDCGIEIIVDEMPEEGY